MLRLVAVLTTSLVAAGGWAVVTVKDLPEYVVAGQRYTVQFQVRQHGRTLMNNVEPRLVVGDSTIAATRVGDGTYTASFVAPQADQVDLTIMSGWGASNLHLYPVRVVKAGAAAPAALSARERGQMLFVAKGCNSCHVNSDLADRPDNQSLTVGPALSGRQLARDYVLNKIKNPNSQIMPNLSLSDAEAQAIASFVSASSPGSADRASR